MAQNSDKLANKIQSIFDHQRNAFRRYGAPSLGSRKLMLNKLLDEIILYKDEIIQAISKDFGHRSYHESLMAEILCCVNSIKHARRYLGKWMKPTPKPVPWYSQPGKAMIHYQPLGVVGIISPWNYPFQLCIGPLIPAIAAGNRVMLKPSNQTPATAEIINKIISRIFDPQEVAVILGPQVNDLFIELPFDHLFYTGSSRVGHIIMNAASKHLTPVTLELGGKSPVIVADDYALDKAVTSIMVGKLFNAGQTCIAVNHALIPKDKIEQFVDLAIKQTHRMYPTIADNPDYTSIISKPRYDRLMALIRDAREKGARVIETHSNETNMVEKQKISPTIILDVTNDMDIVKEEIFGPILPIIPYHAIYDAIEYIENQPRPLALYCFTDNPDTVDTILKSTTSGGACINDTLVHFIQDDLPFGGVGHSGMGRYHGVYGFETFSNQKGVYYQSRFNMMAAFRPPYGAVFKRVTDFLIGK